jgi:hypothetical protein
MHVPSGFGVTPASAGSIVTDVAGTDCSAAVGLLFVIIPFLLRLDTAKRWHLSPVICIASLLV